MKYLNYFKTALNSIYEISVILNSSTNRRHALYGVVKQMQNTLSVERAFILLHDQHTHRLMLEASAGLDEAIAASVSFQSDEGMVGKVFRLGVPILIPDIEREPQFLNKLKRPPASEQTSFIAVPLKFQANTLGVLAVDKFSSRMNSVTTEVEILKMIANLIASFLHKNEFFENELSMVQDEKIRIEAENLSLINEIKSKYSFKGLAGTSKLMEKVFDKITMVTNTSASVLIRGESGTGKEVVAKTVHYNSDRSTKPFVAVNCAAIPSDLIESELFGYAKGAFAGASAEKKGKFEQAEGGTVFLDEVGDMPMEAQSKLLRVLQDKTIEKLGTVESTKVDVRILAATNKNLEEAVQAGKFRLDLYYRLNVFTIDLPPLRKRKEDIPAICEVILGKLNTSYGKNYTLDATTVAALSHCNWPGNIRELENCLERAALTAGDGLIKPEHISCSRGDFCLSHVIGEECPEGDEPISDDGNSDKTQLLLALQKAGWVQAKAARMLNMTVRQVNYRIAKYGIEVKKI
ncbi:sigma 54-interacting transcriptional regulator [Seleniivibrio sp.]|uniref:sigma 54-interacting transcriptional regulator n=1 Tax=Seleniivibrio sp. TaxID=2898801 RepID=UPI0025EF586E|nr:sigma 54-interacting transcriptional regulator [Seleniivibrio sp.]MCD8552438.1 sigma 54-interacting transcriptional regulator [Seleniivibrio sp.]